MESVCVLYGAGIMGGGEEGALKYNAGHCQGGGDFKKT